MSAKARKRVNVSMRERHARAAEARRRPNFPPDKLEMPKPGTRRHDFHVALLEFIAANNRT